MFCFNGTESRVRSYVSTMYISSLGQVGLYACRSGEKRRWIVKRTGVWVEVEKGKVYMTRTYSSRILPFFFFGYALTHVFTARV